MKQELENEIKLIEKLILNYNKDFINITYHKNILYLKDRVYDNNNYYLTKFYNSDNFYEKTYSICNYFLFSNSLKDSFYYNDYDDYDDYYNDPYDFYDENIKSQDYDFEIKAIKTQKNVGRFDNFIQIKNNYFFGIDTHDSSAKIYNYNKNDGLNLIYKLKTWTFNGYHHSSKLSLDKKQILVTYKDEDNNHNIIKILNLDVSKYKLELSSDKIDSQFQIPDGLLYCTELKKGLIAGICRNKIIIMSEKNKIYKLIKTIEHPNHFHYYYDLQIKNNEFYISFCFYNDSIWNRQEDFVEFFDVESLESIKKVKIADNLPIPSSYDYNERKIFVIKDYLIFTSGNYLDKIILLSIRTKEIVQYFQIQFNSIIFIKNAQIIQIYQRRQYGFRMTNLKIEEGLLEYYDEKANKIIQKDESFKKIKCLDSDNIKEIYYMDENESLYDINFDHLRRFGVLNNV